MGFKKVSTTISLIFSLIFVGYMPPASAGVGHVTHTLLTEDNDEGALLIEAKKLREDLDELTRRIVELGHQAIQAGDGEMLSCARELESDLHGLQKVGKEMETALITSLTEENPRLKVHGMRLLDLLEARAEKIEQAKDACRGESQQVYVEIGNFTPVWGQ